MIEKCQSCGIVHRHVEAIGIWHCPNALCRGAGAACWRMKLKSYEESYGIHHVNEKERIFKGILSNIIRRIWYFRW